MSENKKNLSLGEPISEDQLDAVTGGANGTQGNPYRAAYCWFQADGGPREDGRVRCQRTCTGLFLGNTHVGDREPGAVWWACRMWGTNSCIDRWHVMDHECQQEVCLRNPKPTSLF